MSRSPLLSLLLLIVLLMSACQPKTPASQPPKDAPVIEAFLEQQAMCEGKMEWTLDASTKDWIDVSIDWKAADTASAQDNIKHIKLEMSLDGTPLADSMKYPQAPEPFSINCGGTTIEGSGIKFALFLPPLSKGEHKIAWHATVLDDLNDGWSDYPKGTEFTLTAKVTVK
jgi:hypothetical protein